MSPWFPFVAQHLLPVPLLIVGAVVPVLMLRGRMVAAVGTAGLGALLWSLARMAASGLGDREAAIVAYAPIVGATVAFVAMAIGLVLYEGLTGSALFGLLPARLRRAATWLFAPAGTDRPRPTGR